MQQLCLGEHNAAAGRHRLGAHRHGRQATARAAGAVRGARARRPASRRRRLGRRLRALAQRVADSRRHPGRRPLPPRPAGAVGALRHGAGDQRRRPLHRARLRGHRRRPASPTRARWQLTHDHDRGVAPHRRAARRDELRPPGARRCPSWRDYAGCVEGKTSALFALPRRGRGAHRRSLARRGGGAGRRLPAARPAVPDPGRHPRPVRRQRPRSARLRPGADRARRPPSSSSTCACIPADARWLLRILTAPRAETTRRPRSPRSSRRFAGDGALAAVWQRIDELRDDARSRRAVLARERPLARAGAAVRRRALAPVAHTRPGACDARAACVACRGWLAPSSSSARCKIVELWLGFFVGVALLGRAPLHDGRGRSPSSALILVAGIAVIAATCSLDDIVGVRDGVDQANHRGRRALGRRQADPRRAAGASARPSASCTCSASSPSSATAATLALAWPLPAWLVVAMLAMMLLAVNYSYGLKLSYHGAGELVIFVGGAGTVLLPYALVAKRRRRRCCSSASLVGAWHAQVVMFSNTKDAAGDRATGRMTIAARTSPRGNRSLHRRRLRRRLDADGGRRSPPRWRARLVRAAARRRCGRCSAPAVARARPAPLARRAPDSAFACCASASPRWHCPPLAPRLTQGRTPMTSSQHALNALFDGARRGRLAPTRATSSCSTATSITTRLRVAIADTVARHPVLCGRSPRNPSSTPLPPPSCGCTRSITTTPRASTRTSSS